MTLIEALLLIVVAGVGIGASVWAGGIFGGVGYVAGFLGGPIVLYGGIRALLLLDDQIFTGGMSLPVCSCGVPGREGWSYEHFDRTDEPRYGYRCTCGERYIRRGGRVLRLMPGSALASFARWRFGKWHADASDIRTKAPYR